MLFKNPRIIHPVSS